MKRKIINGVIAAIAVCSFAIAGCGDSSKSGNSIKVPDYNVDDYVTLGQYKEFQVEFEGNMTVTDEEVETQIKSTLMSATTYEEIKDRDTTKKGDFVYIDYSGKIDGEVFDGGTASNQLLELGSGQMIPGFEDQIIGHKVGEEFDIKATFPENYGSEKLNGKEAVFTIKLLSINKKVVPTLTDEFVKTVSSKSTSVAEYKKEMKELIQAERDKQVQQYKEYYAQSNAIQNATVEKLPEKYLEKMVQDYKDAVAQVAKDNQQTYEGYVKDVFGMEISEFEKQLNEYMESNAKTSLTIEAIQKKENLTMSDDEMKAAMEDYAKGNDYASVEEMLKKVKETDLKTYLQQSKVLKFISDSSTIVEKKKSEE